MNPEQLREHAEELVTLDRIRPRQMVLRRAVSTAYYAVFHLLTEAASVSLVGATPTLVHAATRWFSHTQMATTCGLFTASQVSGKLAKNVRFQLPVSQSLQDVARAFIQLQQARHQADYDSSHTFTRQQAKQSVDQASQLFEDFENSKSDAWHPAFLLLLLTGDKIVER